MRWLAAFNLSNRNSDRSIDDDDFRAARPVTGPDAISVAAILRRSTFQPSAWRTARNVIGPPCAASRARSCRWETSAAAGFAGSPLKSFSVAREAAGLGSARALRALVGTPAGSESRAERMRDSHLLISRRRCRRWQARARG